MAGDKKITIQTVAEAKGFETPVKEIRKISDEVSKLNKVIRDVGKPTQGQQPGLFGRWFGGGKAGDGLGKQVSADIKELAKFQGALEKTGKIVDNSLSKNYAKSRRELSSFLREQDKLISDRSGLEKKLLGVRNEAKELIGDSSEMGKAAKMAGQLIAEEIVAEIRAKDKEIAAGAANITKKREEVQANAPPTPPTRTEGAIDGMRKWAGRLNMVGMGLDAGESVFNAYSRSSLAPMEYAAGAAQTTGKLYSEITRGDFSSMAALMRNGGLQLSNINDMDGNLARIASGSSAAAGGAVLGAASDAVGGLGQALGGTALAAASNGMMGGPANGMNRMAGGLTALRNGGAFMDANQAQAINQAIENAKASDPIFNLVAQEAFAKAKPYAKHTRMVGGFDNFGDAVYAGADEGLNDSEVMSLQMQLRNRMGENRGNQMFETAAKSERMYGIDRNRAVGALSALTDGAGGNVNAAKQQWEELMSRAFAKGIKDSRLKDEIADAVAGSGYGQGGKFDASAIGEMMKNMLNGNSTALDAKIARDAISFSEKFFGADTGQGGINTIKMHAGQNMAKSLVGSGLLKGREHLASDPNFHTAIQNMTPAEMEAGGNEQIWNLAGYSSPGQVPQQFKDAIRNEGRKFRGDVSGAVSRHAVNSTSLNKLQAIIESKIGKVGLKQGMAELTGNPAIFKSLTPQEQQLVTSYTSSMATANSEIAGGTFSAAKESMGIMFGSTTGNPSGPAGNVSQQQTSGNVATNINQGQAQAAADLFARMSDPKNVQALEGAARASIELIAQFSKMGNPQFVGNPGVVLEQAAVAIKKLTDAAGDFVKTTNTIKASSFKQSN